jgi:CheY-like chemotaxis protein
MSEASPRAKLILPHTTANPDPSSAPLPSQRSGISLGGRAGGGGFLKPVRADGCSVRGRVFPTQKPPRKTDDRCMAASVLIVDDDPTFRALAIRLIAACGMTVVGEADGVADALSKALALKPSAALVDVGLPDGDGFELARELTALPWRPRVVVTSVQKNAGSPDEVRRSRAQAFIPKADLPGAPLAQLLGGE